MVRLADWPRNPYLNDELHEWVRLHLDALGVDDVAVYATPSGREDDERRILVVTEVGLLDGWYAPRGSTARYSLSVRLYPWQSVHGVDLRGETFRLWAHEHQSRWRLRLTRPALDTVADSPELGRALTQFAAACSVMAEPAGAIEAPAEGPAAEELPAADVPRSEPPGSDAPRADAEPVAALAEPDLPPGASDGNPPPEDRRSPLGPLEEVVVNLGEVNPLPAGPQSATEPETAREPASEGQRPVDLARRLGLR